MASTRRGAKTGGDVDASKETQPVVKATGPASKKANKGPVGKGKAGPQAGKGTQKTAKAAKARADRQPAKPKSQAAPKRKAASAASSSKGPAKKKTKTGKHAVPEEPPAAVEGHGHADATAEEEHSHADAAAEEEHGHADAAAEEEHGHADAAADDPTEQTDAAANVEYVEFWAVGEAKDYTGPENVPRVFRKFEEPYRGAKNIISLPAYERLTLKIYNELDLRNPEANGLVRSPKDWIGEAIVEVIHRQVADYEAEVQKKAPEIWELWSICEATVFAFISSDDYHWTGIGGYDGIRGFLRVLGAMFVDGLGRMKAAGLVAPGSAIQNIGLVMGLMLEVSDNYENTVNMLVEPCNWKGDIVRLAERQAIELLTLFETVESYKMDDRDRKRLRVKRSFLRVVAHYKRLLSSGTNQWPDLEAHHLHRLTPAEKETLGGYIGYSPIADAMAEAEAEKEKRKSKKSNGR